MADAAHYGWGVFDAAGMTEGLERVNPRPNRIAESPKPETLKPEALKSRFLDRRPSWPGN
eukprot:2067765-Rhodomonas_salina.1